MVSIGYVSMAEVPGIPILPKSPVAVVYALGWVLFYAAFWWVRRPGDSPYEHL